MIAVCVLLAPGPSRADTRSVSVVNFSFAPQTLQANPGDTIRWTWDGGTHTVTAYQGDSFNSGSHPAGDPAFTRVYNGSNILYRCQIHSSLSAGQCDGMCGAILPLDTTAPAPPTVTSPLNGASLPDGSVTFQGTAPADATIVRIKENGVSLGSATVISNAWEIAVDLARGPHTIGVTALDAAGNESDSVIRFLTIEDTAQPPAPAITSPQNGAAVRTIQVTVAGTASQDTVSVRLYEDEHLFRSVPATGGSWSILETFTEGRHQLTARALDAAGNEGIPSAIVSFLVDVSSPSIEITSQGSVGASFVPFAMSGEASDNFELASVRLVVVDILTGVSRTYDATCPTCGTTGSPWSVTAGGGPGAYEVTARAVDRAGNEGASDPVTLILL